MRNSRNNINDTDKFIMCELKMYTAVQVCLQELDRPTTFNRVAIC